jgi:ribonuclease BN (tRNA processing enzyme)
MDRRTFLAAAAALAPGLRTMADGPPRPPSRAGTRLILLGTAGGPRPRPTRAASAQVIVANDSAYVVDCGNGVARQMAMARVPLPSIRNVFITHHHSDHNADYGTLLLLAWSSGLATPIDTWGPPPLAHITETFFDMSATDIDARMRDEGRVDPRPLVRPHELRTGGPIVEDGNLKVTAALVDHPPMSFAFAYRFDAPDRSIVISGDTRRSDTLIALARGADILVHEAMLADAVDRLIVDVPNAPDLKRSILSHHTTAEDAGRVAQSAGVRTLVLSHLVPAEDPGVSDEMWIEAARRHFSGSVIVGRDLLEI